MSNAQVPRQKPAWTTRLFEFATPPLSPDGSENEIKSEPPDFHLSTYQEHGCDTSDASAWTIPLHGPGWWSEWKGKAVQFEKDTSTWWGHDRRYNSGESAGAWPNQGNGWSETNWQKHNDPLAGRRVFNQGDPWTKRDPWSGYRVKARARWSPGSPDGRAGSTWTSPDGFGEKPGTSRSPIGHEGLRAWYDDEFTPTLDGGSPSESQGEKYALLGDDYDDGDSNLSQDPEACQSQTYAGGQSRWRRRFRQKRGCDDHLRYEDYFEGRLRATASTAFAEAPPMYDIASDHDDCDLFEADWWQDSSESQEAPACLVAAPPFPSKMSGGIDIFADLYVESLFIDVAAECLDSDGSDDSHVVQVLQNQCVQGPGRGKGGNSNMHQCAQGPGRGGSPAANPSFLSTRSFGSPVNVGLEDRVLPHDVCAGEESFGKGQWSRTDSRVAGH